MGTISRFEDLELWKTARELALKIFNCTNVVPLANDFKFRDQLRAAAGSVMDNIAEGYERGSRLEFIQFLGFAKGSCGEVRSQLYRAVDQFYISKDKGEELILFYQNLAKRLAGFIQYLNKSQFKGQKYKERSS